MNPQLMRAIGVTSFGSPENFQELELPVREPDAREILIRVKAASLNPIDAKLRRGLWGAPLPLIPGHDLAGVVERVGEGVRRIRPGDQVWAYLGGPRSNGSYAEYVTVPEDFVGLMPERLTFLEAAAVPVVGLTVFQAIHLKAKPTVDHRVFIAGGAGGLGSSAIQQLQNLGIRAIVATAGHARSVDFLQDHLGLDPGQIVSYAGNSVSALAAEAIERNGGHLFDKVFDFVGGDMKKLCVEVVNFDGDIVSVVEEESGFDLGIWNGQESPLFRKSASLHFHLLGARGLYGDGASWGRYHQGLDELARLFDQGRMRSLGVKYLGDLSPFTIRKGHELLEAGHVQGKLVVAMP